MAATLAGGGFANEPDSDLTDRATRDSIWAAVAAPPENEVPIADEIAAIDAAVARAVEAGTRWAAVPAGERAAMLRRIATVISAERVTAIARDGRRGRQDGPRGRP